MAFRHEEKSALDLWIFHGSIRIQDVGEMKSAIAMAPAAGKRRMLDLSEVTECDTAGIQLLCAIMIDASKKDLKLDIPVWPSVVNECMENLGINLKGLE